jgi:hypothetical protein
LSLDLVVLLLLLFLCCLSSALVSTSVSQQQQEQRLQPLFLPTTSGPPSVSLLSRTSIVPTNDDTNDTTNAVEAATTATTATAAIYSRRQRRALVCLQPNRQPQHKQHPIDIQVKQLAARRHTRCRLAAAATVAASMTLICCSSY